MNTRVRPRFFDQVGNETMCEYIGNIISLNHVIIKPTKIINNFLKDSKILIFKNSSFSVEN